DLYVDAPLANRRHEVYATALAAAIESLAVEVAEAVRSILQLQFDRRSRRGLHHQPSEEITHLVYTSCMPLDCAVSSSPARITTAPIRSRRGHPSPRMLRGHRTNRRVQWAGTASQ